MSKSNLVSMAVQAAIPLITSIIIVAVAYGALSAEVAAIHDRVDDIHAEVTWIVHTMVERGVEP